MLEVVQHEQHPATPQPAAYRLARTLVWHRRHRQRPRNRRFNIIATRNRRELNPASPVKKTGRTACATASASRVLPTPPGPVSVTSLVSEVVRSPPSPSMSSRLPIVGVGGIGGDSSGRNKALTFSCRSSAPLAAVPWSPSGFACSDRTCLRICSCSRLSAGPGSSPSCSARCARVRW